MPTVIPTISVSCVTLLFRNFEKAITESSSYIINAKVIEIAPAITERSRVPAKR
jgi:hypothetical protein